MFGAFYFGQPYFADAVTITQITPAPAKPTGMPGYVLAITSPATKAIGKTIPATPLIS